MGDVVDPRLNFISEYILKSYKLKPDKWAKCINVEENKILMLEFLEKADNSQLVFTVNPAGLITPSYEFPSALKSTKAIYFIKKGRDPVGKDNIKKTLVYGDLSYTPLEQLSALVDEVSYKNKKSSRQSGLFDFNIQSQVQRHVVKK